MNSTLPVRERVTDVARTGRARLLALLVSRTGDIAAAEDALADAFEQALSVWPDKGIPTNPEAWLLTVARNRLRDRWKSAAERTSVPLDPDRDAAHHLDDIDPDRIEERRLELLLVCAHPGIDPAMRTPLMLATVLGFTAARVGEVFAVPGPTMAARLGRAKKRIKESELPFLIPDRSALPDRLEDVLEAVYGAYAIEWRIAGTRERDGMAAEALYLAETVTHLLPGNAEAHGLAALISLSAARVPARLDPDGVPVPPDRQEIELWDAGLIERGREHLRAAYRQRELGRFQLEAAIQALYCARVETGTVDRQAIAELHEHLYRLSPTLGSGAALAGARAEVQGPEAGLAVLDELGAAADRFQPARAMRAHLLHRLGSPQAAGAYDAAIALTVDPAERLFLERRRAECA